jgi:KilA-N domain
MFELPFRYGLSGGGDLMEKINVLDKEVAIYVQNDKDYICITDIARYKDADRTDYLIQNWLRNQKHHRVPWYLGATKQPGF